MPPSAASHSGPPTACFLAEVAAALGADGPSALFSLEALIDLMEGR